MRKFYTNSRMFVFNFAGFGLVALDGIPGFNEREGKRETVL